MKSILKTAVAVTCGLLVGGGAVQMLHAQSKPPAFVVAEIAVRDLEGYEMNFLKPAQKTIADHGGQVPGGRLQQDPEPVWQRAAEPCRHPSIREHGRG